MRLVPVLVIALVTLSLPLEAQEKSKAPPARTYLDTLDMSSGQAVVQGFIDAYAASDYMRAYYLLSPHAKADFTTAVFEFNAARLFPNLPDGESVNIFTPEYTAESGMLAEIYLDGAVMFDTLMSNVEARGLLPFTLDGAGEPSATIDADAQARFNVPTGGDPGFVIITAIKLPNDQWRVERVVWAVSDPLARPWGRKP